MAGRGKATSRQRRHPCKPRRRPWRRRAAPPSKGGRIHLETRLRDQVTKGSKSELLIGSCLFQQPYISINARCFIKKV